MVGVLALQGDFKEHFAILKKLGASAIAVRLPNDLEEVDRLIIPGGESTVIGKLLKSSKLLSPIRARIKKGMPVWGTCAGAILLAKHVADGIPGQPTIGVMDITARRNAFGRQRDSFAGTVMVKGVGKKSLRVLFIRAPRFEHPGKNVEILSTLGDGSIVAAKEKNMLITAFHPELVGTTELHRYFLSL